TPQRHACHRPFVEPRITSVHVHEEEFDMDKQHRSSEESRPPTPEEMDAVLGGVCQAYQGRLASHVEAFIDGFINVGVTRGSIITLPAPAGFEANFQAAGHPWHGRPLLVGPLLTLWANAWLTRFLG